MIAPALIPFVVIALLYYQASEAEGCHLSCDFDKNLCEYEQPTDDDADWTRIQGETRSSGTGPSSDHTSGDGWYVYFEASNPRKEGDFADLRGPVVKSNSSSEECVTFYYHMRGIGMGSLKVLTYKKKRGVVSFKEIWKIEGQQSRNGTDWKRAKISIKETAPYQLVFRATRGSRFLSDVGLDDIGMSHKACETPCPGLSQVPNGRVVMSSSQPYKVGTEAVWTCNSGYSLRGYRKAICLESGRWSAGLPSCEAPTCLRDPSKLEPDRRCGTRCQGNGSSGCRVLPNVCRCDGWCGMSCLNPNRECPLLSNPEHGSVTLKGRKYGQTARYKCDPGFSLVGPSERSCRSDRKWSGVAPLCFPYGACGLTEETKAVRKIIRGSDARQGAWPWHALLADIRGNGLVTGVFWGGSLIGKKWVLSAATSFAYDFQDQILSKQWNGSFLIFLGMTRGLKNFHDLSEHIQIYEPAMVYLHPEFNKTNFDFDVALIRIGSKMMQLSNGSYRIDESSSGGKVTFSRLVRPVCPPCMNKNIASPSDAWKNFDAQLCSRKGLSSIVHAGSDAVITGFGITKPDDFLSRPDGLQEGHVKVNDDVTCIKYVEALRRNPATEFLRYTDQMLCAAGGTESSKIDMCLGDGGGPLVKKQVQIHDGRKIEYWIQIGIASWGPRKCGAELPGFYTSVPTVMKWIWKTLDVNKILPCNSSPCHPNATCFDDGESRFVCECNEGYQGDGKICKNRCGRNEVYKKCGTKCPATCRDPYPENCDKACNSHQHCFCRVGYVQKSDSDKTCVPVDSCPRSMPCDLKPCHINANCWNGEIAGYLCQCKKGYTGDGKLCTKILPCDSNPCDENADCKNERGNRFSCKCRNGYTGNGDICTKILPCDSNPCDQNADCKNERGNRFTCKCRNGYRGDGTSCEKILPCDSNPCDENADCKNERENRFSCKCRKGYKRDGETCSKILPCDSNPCDQNADCQNELAGRFSCKCRDGFQGDGETCKQILPCDANPCDRNAECKNERNNRYSCKCKGGYEGDGKTCTSTESIWGQWTSWKQCDVTCGGGHQERTRACLGSGDCVGHDFETKRCNSQNCDESITTCGGCHADATCVKLHNNRHGCVCKIGYKGDGKFCKKMHCPNIDDVRHGNYRTSSEAPYAVGAVANFGCDVGFKANGKFRLTCLIGGRWSAPIPYCVANVCKRDLRRIEQGRKCRKPCKQDSQCKGAFKRCQCDDWCGRSCFNPNADCVQPTQPRNGYITENGRSYGQTVTYGCDEGFTLNGPSTRICRSDRIWSGHPPICLPYSACGQSVEARGSSSFGKVRGGSNAKQGAWPWQALLIHHLKRTVEQILDMQKVFGGGSVINDEWILSAAHVFDDLFYLSTESNNWDNTFLIILGMTNYPKPGHGIPDHFQIFQPQDVHLHPKFNPQSFDYDIALIRVGTRVTSDGKTSFKVGGVHESRKITFTRYVRPVCLPCMKEDPAKLLDVLEGYSKKICPREGAFTISPNMKNTIMVTGFGRTAHNGSFFPTTLQQGTLKIRDKLMCSESLNDIRYYNEHARYTERMFCASSANDSLKVDACQGDSGGPVVVKMKSDQNVEYWRQIGIVSWGFKCADKHPGFYTSVYSFMDWIWKILDNENKTVVCGEKFFRDNSHYNITSCPAGMAVGSKCSIKCENGYKWTLEESVWTAVCSLKGSNKSEAEWGFQNVPICEI